jgi:diguanylate cyclase (GGDEF)-like protein
VAWEESPRELRLLHGLVSQQVWRPSSGPLLKTSIRGSDAAVRYGGDEFLILLPDTTARGAENVAEVLL